MRAKRYPKIHILSKNDLSKHISHSGFSRTEALALINDVITNFDAYWKDNKGKSEPEKQKFVRSAKGTPLGRMLDNINRMVLEPYDNLLPNFIFGGVNHLNHVKAAEHLLGEKRQRVALKMDISRFFEQVGRDRVFNFFLTRGSCSKKGAKLLADMCCVPIGPKGSGNIHKTIARGFAISSRLSVWCNLDTFIELDRLVKKRLKGNDPRIAIYVDDIGITASRVSKDEMEKLSTEVAELLANFDEHQKLPVNIAKTKITSHEEGIEHLGLRLNRSNLSIGAKTKSKMDRVKNRIEKSLSPEEKKAAQQRFRSLKYYKKYIEEK